MKVRGISMLTIYKKVEKSLDNLSGIIQINNISELSKPFLLCWKKNTLQSINVVFFVPEDFFYELLDAYTKQNNILK